MAITYRWARAEPRRASRRVQRRRSQGLLAEIGLLRTDPVWATATLQAGVPGCPLGEGWGHKGSRSPGDPRGFFPSEKLNPPLRWRENFFQEFLSADKICMRSCHVMLFFPNHPNEGEE